MARSGNADTSAASSRKVSRNDWLAAALEALLTQGVEGIHVEPIAKSLDVSKGSFYWHFQNLGELQEAVVDYWATRMIHSVRGFEGRKDVPAEECLRQLMEEITRQDLGRYECQMRTWSASDERVWKAVRRVDEARLELVMELFRQMGFSEEQAEIRARMMIFYEYGEAEFSIKVPLHKRLEYVGRRLAVLTKPVGEAEPSREAESGGKTESTEAESAGEAGSAVPAEQAESTATG